MTHRSLVKKAICPTPSKVRYSTRREARKQAKDQSVTSGVDLHSYECPCGFYHLSKRARTDYQEPVPTVIGVPHALALNDDEFKAFVIFDVHGKLTSDESAILRHPSIMPRWRATLGVVRTDAENDLRRIKQGVRTPALIGRCEAQNAFIRKVESHQLEVKALTAELSPVVLQATHGERKRLRRTIGDRALEALVNRHRREFSEIFHREADIAGLELRESLDDVLKRLDLEELRAMDVESAAATHRPRYPDVHVVLTGDEDFYEIVSLSVGAIFRHLRDGDGDRHATHAVIDIIGALHKIPTHDVTAAVYIVGDWVTLHMPFFNAQDDDSE